MLGIFIGRRSYAALAAALLLAVVATASDARAAASIPEVSLGEWRAKGRIADAILTRPPRSARSAAARTVRFTDSHGHVLTLATDIPGLDLGRYAQIFAAIRHDAEVEDVVIEVLAPERVASVCGEGAIACYLAEDAATSTRGHIWIPAVDEDLLHIAVHEYGHHVDNQLLNLSHLGICSYDSDGSRNWLFSRQLAGALLADTGCAAGVSWELLLGELFAEDFAWLNGNRNWVLPQRAPTSRQMTAMESDIERAFEPTRTRAQRYAGRGRMRTVAISVKHWSFLSVRFHRTPPIRLRPSPLQAQRTRAARQQRGTRPPRAHRPCDRTRPLRRRHVCAPGKWSRPAADRPRLSARRVAERPAEGL